MMLCRYREALEDCQQAVRLDNSFMKASHGKRSILSRGKSSCSVLQFYHVFFSYYDVVKLDLLTALYKKQMELKKLRSMVFKK